MHKHTIFYKCEYEENATAIVNHRLKACSLYNQLINNMYMKIGHVRRNIYTLYI